MLSKTKHIVTCSALALVMTGCATTQEPSDKLVGLETQYKTLMQKGYVEEYAPIALEEAKEAIAKVEKAEKSGADKATVAQYHYVAQKKLDTALEKARYSQAEEMISNSDVRRKEVQLSAKEKQVDQAMATAEAMRARAAMAEQEAAAARAKVDTLENRASELSKKLENISAEESDRGLVLTMGSILFEVDKATLKPGAEKTLKRVAELLSEYPERNVLVEGYTDSTGSDSYNKDLSQQRAQSVSDLLTQNGIDASRLSTKGYGEEYPVASNDTKAGRQQNRRVELVIAKSDESAVSLRE